MMNRIRATMHGFRRENRAAAMVEFAIVAPLLFILIFGIIDFGFGFFQVNNLTNAARDGARMAATMPNNTGSDAAIVAYVRDKIQVNKDSGTVAVSRFLSNGQSVVLVRISNFPYKPVTSLVIKSTKRFNVRAEFRHEFQ